jgi:hypothetical protein
MEAVSLELTRRLGERFLDSGRVLEGGEVPRERDEEAEQRSVVQQLSLADHWKITSIIKIHCLVAM